MNYQRAIIAAALTVLAAPSLAVAALDGVTTESERRQAESQREIAGHLAEIARLERSLDARAAAPDPLAQPCAAGTDSRSSDLCAQWKAADAAADAAWWTWFTAWISGLSFIGVGVALFLSHRANGIAREGVEAQLRAWVAIDFLETSGFRFEDDVVTFKFRASFENVGATPAIHFRVFADLVFGDRVREEIDSTIKQFEDGTIAWIDTNLFPNRPLAKNILCDHTGIPSEPARTHLYVIAAYNTSFSRKLRVSAVQFEILDLRRGDRLIDFKAAPFGRHLHLGSPHEFVGYTT